MDEGSLDRELLGQQGVVVILHRMADAQRELPAPGHLGPGLGIVEADHQLLGLGAPLAGLQILMWFTMFSGSPTCMMSRPMS